MIFDHTQQRISKHESKISVFPLSHFLNLFNTSTAQPFLYMRYGL